VGRTFDFVRNSRLLHIHGEHGGPPNHFLAKASFSVLLSITTP
jgi:hypothetical protein